MYVPERNTQNDIISMMSPFSTLKLNLHIKSFPSECDKKYLLKIHHFNNKILK